MNNARMMLKYQTREFVIAGIASSIYLWHRSVYHHDVEQAYMVAVNALIYPWLSLIIVCTVIVWKLHNFADSWHML